jgi:hypothetical protein
VNGQHHLDHFTLLSLSPTMPFFTIGSVIQSVIAVLQSPVYPSNNQRYSLAAHANDTKRSKTSVNHTRALKERLEL